MEMDYGTTIVILVMVLAQAGVTKLNKYAGAAVGFVVTTIILFIGINAYNSGGAMTIARIELPQSVFFVLIGVWYLSEIATLVAAVKNVKNKRIAKAEEAMVNDLVGQGLGTGEILATVVRKMHANTLAGDIMTRIIAGESYESMITTLRTQKGLTLENAIVRCKDAFDRIRHLKYYIRYAPASSSDRTGDMTTFSFPAVEVRDTGTLEGYGIKPRDYIVLYEQELVTGVETLEAMIRNGETQSFSLSLLRYETSDDTVTDYEVTPTVTKAVINDKTAFLRDLDKTYVKTVCKNCGSDKITSFDRICPNCRKTLYD